jgi:cap2 methyltransferase
MLSIAWLKMFEVLSFVQDKGFLPRGGSIRSAHFCEAPGGFVCATNHFLHTKLKDVQWSWTALSLNPWYEGSDEMVDSDSFIVGSLPNWEFGADNTGNIMSKHNICAFRKRFLNVAPADIVTGDGGIGCDENPEEQERLTAKLVLYEVIAGIGVLKLHGCLIIKMFTTFTPCSFACIAFIASLFSRCYMLKPATSKPSNSEIYIVACDFTGLPSEQWYVSLLDTVAAADLDARSLISAELISSDWRAMFEQASAAFADLTVFNLNRILRFVEPRGPDDPPPKADDSARTKSLWSSIFGRRHSIACLPARLWIVQKQSCAPPLQSVSTPGQKRMRVGGTMEERRDTNKLRATIIAGDVSALHNDHPVVAAGVADLGMDPKFARMLGNPAISKAVPSPAAADDKQESACTEATSVLHISGDAASVQQPDARADSVLNSSSSHLPPHVEAPSSVLTAIIAAQRAFGDRSGIGSFSAASSSARLHCSAQHPQVAATFGLPFSRIVHSKFCSKRHPAVESSLTLVLELARSRLQRVAQCSDKADASADRGLLHCGKVAQLLLSADALPRLMSAIESESFRILNGWACV